jgi:hypothetical protein
MCENPIQLDLKICCRDNIDLNIIVNRMNSELDFSPYKTVDRINT